jgi:hypothetical protein
MRNAKRGRGSRHWVYFAGAAALGLALSGCGGGSSTAAASSTSTQSTVSAQGTSADGGTSAGGGTSTGGSTSAGTGTSAGRGTSTSGGTAGSGKTAGTGSSSTSGTSPTVHADSVTINWTPPTENTNGTPLTNLAGYNIHYGTSSGSLSRKIAVSNPGIAIYVVSDLSPGKYYFAVAAVNSAGTESPLSAQVSATVTN